MRRTGFVWLAAAWGSGLAFSACGGDACVECGAETGGRRGELSSGGWVGKGGAWSAGGKRVDAGGSPGAWGGEDWGMGGAGGDWGASGAPWGRGGKSAASGGRNTGGRVEGGTAGGGAGGEGAAETGGTESGGIASGGRGNGGSGPFAEAGAGGAVAILDWDFDPAACDGFTCGYGTCVKEGAVQRCECKPGFEGERCDVDVDECQQNPCVGACTNTRGSFECGCPLGLAGTKCQHAAFRGMGVLPGYVGMSFVALSRDGTHAVATAGPQGSRRAVLFDVESGALIDVNPAGAVDCEATAVNGDGSKVFGHCASSFVWSEGTARFLEGQLADTQINSVSADGTVLVGSSPNTVTPYKTAFRATAREFTWLGVWGQSHSDAHSVSADGSIVALRSDAEGYVWSTRDGLRRLTYGPSDRHQYDFFVTSDGSAIVGSGATEFAGADEESVSRTAPGLLWRGTRREVVAGGILVSSVDVRTVAGRFSMTRYFPIARTFVSEFLEDVTAQTDLFYRVRANAPDGWYLESVRGISDGGKVVAGNGRYDSHAQAWVAYLP